MNYRGRIEFTNHASEHLQPSVYFILRSGTCIINLFGKRGRKYKAERAHRGGPHYALVEGQGSFGLGVLKWVNIRRGERGKDKSYFVRLVVTQGIFSTSEVPSFPALSFFGFLIQPSIFHKLGVISQA